MKRNNLHVGLMAFAMLLIGASCSDDDNTLSYSTGAVQNTELKTILVQRGYTFNEDGNLLLDDLANNTTTLDLSGTQISTDALAELSMFPNLTDVDLSDNGYGPAFDFAKLPKKSATALSGSWESPFRLAFLLIKSPQNSAVIIKSPMP